MNGFDKNASAAALIAASIVVFFSIMFSAFPDAVKFVVGMVVLGLTGSALKKITGVEEYYGVILLRGKSGFNLMKHIASRHGNLAREAADFGMSIGFGLFYAWKIFGRQRAEYATSLLDRCARLCIQRYCRLVRRSKKMGVPEFVLETWQFIVYYFTRRLYRVSRQLLQTKGMKYVLHGFGSLACFGAITLLAGGGIDKMSPLAFLGLGIAGGLFLQGIVFLALQAYAILTVPAAPAGVMLIIPGITVPIEWLVALLIAAAVHELSHGILCYVEKLRVTSSGAIFFGFLPIGAFVEPDEKKLAEFPVEKKRRILVAGSTANFFTVFVFILLAVAVVAVYPLATGGMSIAAVSNTSAAFGVFEPNEIIRQINGVEVRSSLDLQRVLAGPNPEWHVVTDKRTADIDAWELKIAGVLHNKSACQPIEKVNPNNGCFKFYEWSCGAFGVLCNEKLAEMTFSPAFGILQAGDTIYKVDGASVKTIEELQNELKKKTPGQVVELATSRGPKQVRLDENGKMGVMGATSLAFSLREEPRKGAEIFYWLVRLAAIIVNSTIVLNFALAMINLLPLFITDGSRILLEEAFGWFGENHKTPFKKSKAKKMAVAAGIAMIIVLLVNLALPAIL